MQRVPGGEVSPHLLDLLLVAGGSGIAPLMAMVRTRAAMGSRVPCRTSRSSCSAGAGGDAMAGNPKVQVAELCRAKSRGRSSLVTTRLCVVSDGRLVIGSGHQQLLVVRIQRRGDPRVHLWNYADPALDRLRCDWHFSARDHRLIAEKLRDYLAGLSLRW